MDLDQLKADIHAILADRAVLEKIIYYGELVDVLKRMRPEVYEWSLMPHYKFFHDLLGDISGHTLEKHGFALTALVVGKSTGLPGAEFLRWGRDEEWPYFDQGDEVMITEQLRLIFKYYRIRR